MARTRIIASLVCSAAFLVAGCGDDGGPQDVNLTQGQAQQAGLGVADQAANLVDGFTLSGLGETPFQKVASRAPVTGRLQRLLFATLASGEECAAFSDTTDSDGDGVPDDLTVTFSSPACTTFGDSGTAVVSGSFRVTDPGTSPGFNIAYSNVRFRVESTVDNDYFELRVNGTQAVSATTSSASLGENMTLTLAARSGTLVSNFSLQDNWAATFSADVADSYDVRSPLPNGTLEVTGNSVWTANGVAATLGVTTPQPLVHQASCLEPPTFESGQLRALVIGNRGGAFVRVQFIGCGQEPIVTLIGQPSL